LSIALPTPRHESLPDEVGEVSPSYGDGEVKLMTHDPSGASRHLPALARREEALSGFMIGE